MVYSRCCQVAFLTRSCCRCHVDQVESEAAEATWPDLCHCESKPAQWCIAEWFDLLCCGPALVLAEDLAGLRSAPVTENKMSNWTDYKMSQNDERIFCLTCHSTLPLLVLPVLWVSKYGWKVHEETIWLQSIFKLTTMGIMNTKIPQNTSGI